MYGGGVVGGVAWRCRVEVYGVWWRCSGRCCVEV